MPYVLHRGCRLHYQVLGEGPPLLLQHGFTSSSGAWQHFGFTAALQKHFQLIMPDARGHGLSDKPHDPASYTQAERVADVLAVLDALGIERTHFFGYSMGGWIGYGLAQSAPQRLRSMVLGAAHPYADTQWDHFLGIDGRDADAFITAFEAVLDEALSEPVKMLVRANDLQALAAAAQHSRPSMEALLSGMDMPCLLYCGDADARHEAVQRFASSLAQGQFASLPGVSHFAGLMRSDLVLPLVTAFLLEQRARA
ncbi:alpha/beta fold hydrolase [Herbaspirillum sp. RTI4]|uniref:alpha/beta fold hydrolase n=1 Tax=Herbaspirillum sp. RTI4 TaxID=3048640 RepID=UPI002AB33C9F|nr:alpha/beta fold hydrolase [Herbaspirillum sp. RTI4]MDY7578443.1 alpha/beta fold hydrolase [Herbaspirillum sp. RTI4]MEA9982543.1 alpha/beta fold hydrolase [Herbaspirillum sp. RTI4]